MIHKSLFAVAASLMTLTAFSGTLAVLQGGQAPVAAQGPSA
jgi:hypothetical protein